MTEFTADEIKKLRSYLEFSHGTYIEKYLERTLDEIERQRDLISAYENDLVLLSVYGKLKRIESEIKESNDLLRSAFMIAKRDGKETNWEAWRKQLNNALERQHAMMYGEKAQQALKEVTK